MTSAATEYGFETSDGKATRLLAVVVALIAQRWPEGARRTPLSATAAVALTLEDRPSNGFILLRATYGRKVRQICISLWIRPSRGCAVRMTSAETGHSHFCQTDVGTIYGKLIVQYDRGKRWSRQSAAESASIDGVIARGTSIFEARVSVVSSATRCRRIDTRHRR